MLRLLVSIGTMVGAAAIGIWAIGSYLAVDDIKHCSRPNAAQEGCQPADAIVAVSGGDTQARTAEAIYLYKSGWAPVVIFSGAARDTSGPSNAEAMRAQAIAAGVPDSAIRLDKQAIDTSQNAIGVFTVLPIQSERIILVTSPYHQRRASIEFQKIFGDTIQVVNRPATNDKHWDDNWWRTPHGWFLATSELFKIMVTSAWRL